MAYPSSLDSFTNPGASQKLNNPSHSTIETAQNTALAALETKVGITGSAVSSTIDYKLTSASSTSPGHKHVVADITDAGSFVPTGMMMRYAGTSVPTGYLQANGAAVSRTTYAGLFAVTSTVYGTGDGSTTFNIPMFYPDVTSLSLYAVKLASASSQHLTKSSPTGLSITGDLSISMWLNITSLPTSGNVMVICGRWGSAGNRGFQVVLFNNSGTQTIRTILSSDGTSTTNLDLVKTLSTTTWLHFAVTYKASTGIATYYVDGASAGSASGGPASYFASTAAFDIGSDVQASGTSYLNSYVANLKVFNATLTQGDVVGSMVYLNGSNCQGSWSLDNVLTDSSGNNNTLTNNGTAVFSINNIYDILLVPCIKT